jgi:hypothetical protein
MVKGLDVFKAWFADHADQYILIGGTAASMAMDEAGLDFRATKDLDVVLHVEALTPAFGDTFWKFIQAAGYQIRQASDTSKPAFYRFQKPADPTFPAMVELFSRAPDSLRPIGDGKLTRIPFDEAISSLSAILLDDSYYAFIMAGRRELDGLPWVGEDRLIPLKAIAWLDLSTRKKQGESIDSKNIRKHFNDVLRLSQLLTATMRIPLDAQITDDMKRFVGAASIDATLDPRALGLGNVTLAEVLGRLVQTYNLDEDAKH